VKGKSIVASTILVAVATVTVRLFSFVREMVLASSYGAGMVSDAFVISFTLPTIVLALLGTSTATVFIPVYTKIESDKEYFTSNILTLLALVGLLFTAVFATFPESLVFIFASQLNTETFTLATELLRIMTWAAIPILLIGLLQSYLQIKNAFFTAAILIIPINIYTILSILLSKSVEVPSIMAYGVVIGNIMALIFLFAAVYRKGYIYKPVINLKMPELQMLFVMLAPVILSIFINDLNQIVDRNFASSLAVGSISSLNYAGKSINILIATIGAPLATVLYPRMSEFAAQGNTVEIRKCITECTKRLIPVLLPAVVGIFIMAEPVIRILFQRGEFTSHNTQIAMECLRMYAPLLLFSSLNAIITRALFSVSDTKSPAIISAICVAVSIAINFILIGPLAHIGLALSTSISAMLTTILLLIVLRKRIGLLHLKRNAKEWCKVLIATVIMSITVSIGLYLLPVMDGNTIQCILLTGVLVLLGVSVYILMHKILKTDFISESVILIRNILKSRQNKKEKTNEL